MPNFTTQDKDSIKSQFAKIAQVFPQMHCEYDWAEERIIPVNFTVAVDPDYVKIPLFWAFTQVAHYTDEDKGMRALNVERLSAQFRNGLPSVSRQHMELFGISYFGKPINQNAINALSGQQDLLGDKDGSLMAHIVGQMTRKMGADIWVVNGTRDRADTHKIYLALPVPE